MTPARPLLLVVSTLSAIFVVIYFFVGYNPRRRNIETVHVTYKGDEVLPSLVTTDEMLYLIYGKSDEAKQYNQYDPFLMRHINSHMCRPNPLRTSKFRNTSRRHRSQIGQSQLVDRLLRRRTNGFFVEAGAADGLTFSNSYFFELERNWTGLLIEGNPDLHRRLLENNRNAVVLRACLGVEPRPMTVKMKLGKLIGGITDIVQQDSRRYSQIASAPEAVVPSFPLNSIMAAIGVHHIDYMSLDVEGAEVGVLQNVDWKRMRIDVLTVEYNGDYGRLRQIQKILVTTGMYQQVMLMGGQDVVFLRKDATKRSAGN